MSKARYKLKDGTGTVGVTTVTGELGWNKQILINWSNRLGLNGTKVGGFVDDKADIGTMAHGLVLEHHNGKKFDTSDYSGKQIISAKNSLASYLAWLKGKELEPILLETPLVSEEFKYGGTPDNYCRLDGKYTLLDYKSGKGIYLEHYIQVGGGYRQLLLEHGHKIDQVIILNIPRMEDESFQYKVIKRVDVCWEIFFRALAIYRLKKELEK